jgi:hypothetical protein
MVSPYPISLERCGSLRHSTHQRATADSSAAGLLVSRTRARTSINVALAAGLLPAPQRALALVKSSIELSTCRQTVRRASASGACSLSLSRLTVSSTRIFSQADMPDSGVRPCRLTSSSIASWANTEKAVALPQCATLPQGRQGKKKPPSPIRCRGLSWSAAMRRNPVLLRR